MIKPTRYRWVVLALFCSLYLISYIDRGLMSVVAPEISEEFELDSVQMGWLFAVFTWAYAFAQIPVGFLGDRIGPLKPLKSGEVCVATIDFGLFLNSECRNLSATRQVASRS